MGGISISSSFQRGDEETGIWTSEFKQHFIDSLQKGYPSGILTFVKGHISATAYQNPWKVLDGGNRLRAIRDYIDDRFVDLSGNSFSQKKICEGTFTAPDANKMITFYNSLTDNIELKAQYTDLFKGSNSETGNAKIQKIVDFVLADHH